MKYPDDYLNKIIQGDCLEIMKGIPDKSIDLVLTDPPYGIGKMVIGTMSKKRMHKTQYDSFEDSEDYVKKICVPAIELCLKISHRTILTPGSKCMSLYPRPDSFGCMHSIASMGMQLWGRMDCSPIFYYGKPFDIGKKIHKCSYDVNEHPSCKEHPCSKPLKFWSEIIRTRTKEGDTVLDPFLGSGTTAVACKMLNRNYIGVELSEKYCQIARDRIENTLPLFD
jgi:DNA modification methylase